MLRGCIPIVLFALCAGHAAAQAAAAPHATVEWPAVHYAGDGVVAPVLLTGSFFVTPPKSCRRKISGTAKVFLVVNSKGISIESFFVHPVGNDLDKMVLNVVNMDRFQPGTLNGTPVAAAITDEVKMQTCLAEQKDSSGQKDYSLQPRSLPEQKIALQTSPIEGPKAPLPSEKDIPQEATPLGIYRVGGPITAPVPLNHVEAEFTEEARIARIIGVCLISVSVDAHGMPQNLRIVKGLEPSLDANALTAVSKYRFTPAMNNGVPVPVMITVTVNFRTY
jgi:TonB family protein